MSKSVLPTLVAMRQRRGVIHHVPHNQNRYFKFPQQCYMLTIKNKHSNGRGWITCFIIFVCRAEGDESRLLSSLFAERNVMNHAPTAHALLFTTWKIMYWEIVNESPCASHGAWFFMFRLTHQASFRTFYSCNLLVLNGKEAIISFTEIFLFLFLFGNNA